MTVSGENINWPTPKEYDWALQNRRTTFSDPDIQYGPLQEIAGLPARLNGGGSRYVCVYKVGNWVVRCFTAQLPAVGPPSDIALRYRVITDYLNCYCASPELSFLVPHIWIEHGVNVKGEALPFVKVPFIPDSQPLGDFLTRHYHDHRITRVLTQQWFEVVRQLEAHQIAHGDLDMTNILVCGQPPNISLKLIDYDGMYVPGLAKYGLGVADNGHAHFQPPRASIRTFGPTMDCFSVLIIYITLSALTSNYELWENCDADETHPLLGAGDFVRLGSSRNFTRLLQEGNNSGLQLCLRELQNAVIHSRMPRRLSDILEPVKNSGC